MATPKELEEIFGTPKRTIETWSRTRDDRYLLSIYLKSFSSLDIEERLVKILKKEGFVKKKEIDFIQDLIEDPVKAGISESECVEVISDSRLEDTSIAPDYLLKLADGTLQVVELISLLPSRTHLEKKIKKLMTFAENFSLNHEIII